MSREYGEFVEGFGVLYAIVEDGEDFGEFEGADGTGDIPRELY